MLNVSLLYLLSTVVVVVRGQEEDAIMFRTRTVDGSGTTNSAKCYWSVMETLMEQAKPSVRLTYRAIGNSVGQVEFINDFNSNVSLTDFSSGDLPISSEQYAGLSSAGIDMVHLPVLMGAVSFFHSFSFSSSTSATIATNDEDDHHLNVTGCVLAKIFLHNITTWDDPALTDLNPAILNSHNISGLPIRVVTRSRGSSTTRRITEYFYASCPSVWPEDMVGSLIPWPIDTIECQGSVGVVECIQETEGAIGYLDAGLGVFNGLTEVNLMNRDGYLVSSQTAAMNGGITASGEGVFPSSFDADFGGVSLVNQPGRWTWPLVEVMYIYVRSCSPKDNNLLKAFLRAMYNPDINFVCSDLGFALPSHSVRSRALVAIDFLLKPSENDDSEWVFESNVLPAEGAGDFVFSSRRRSATNLRLLETQDQTADLVKLVLDLQNMVLEHKDAIAALETRLDQSEEYAMANLTEQNDTLAQIEEAQQSCTCRNHTRELDATLNPIGSASAAVARNYSALLAATVSLLAYFAGSIML